MSLLVWRNKKSQSLAQGDWLFLSFFMAGHWQAAGEQLACGFSLTN